VRPRLRDGHRDVTAPFDVLTKTTAKELVARQSDFVCRLEERLHKALALRFVDREIGVVAQQCSMPAQLGLVGVGATEDLAQPCRQVFHVSRATLSSKYLDQDWIRQATAILRVSQPVQRFRSPHVLEDGWFSHSSDFLSRSLFLSEQACRLS